MKRHNALLTFSALALFAAATLAADSRTQTQAPSPPMCRSPLGTPIPCPPSSTPATGTAPTPSTQSLPTVPKSGGSTVPVPHVVATGQPPDLVIHDITLDSRCQIVVKAGNLGPGRVPDAVWTRPTPASSSVYLAIDGRPWGGETIWRFDPGRGLQPPGGTATYTSTYVVRGSANVKASIDHTNQVAETNEGNNGQNRMLTCPGAQGLPDITSRRGMTFGGFAHTGAGGRFVAWGGSINLTEADSFERAGAPGYCSFRNNYDLVNAGSAPVTRDFMVRIRRGATLANEHTLPPPFAAGETRNPSMALILPAGTHQLNLSLDDDRVITESNEGNNSFTVFVTVGGKCP